MVVVAGEQRSTRHRRQTYSHRDHQVVGAGVPVAVGSVNGVCAVAAPVGEGQGGNRGVATANPATVFSDGCEARVALHLTAGYADL